MFESIITIIFGTIMLYFGAEWMIKSSVKIASKLNVSKFIIGLTVVAFGTSLPELGVSLKAAIFNKSGIAVGNIIGSNITNVFLVLGLCSLIYPIKLCYSEIKQDLIVYLLVCVLLIILIWDGNLIQWEGLILFSLLLIYTTFLFYSGSNKEEAINTKFSGWSLTIILFFVGIILLIFGTDLFIKGSIKFAKILGVSDLVIGMTIVALGTSLPELVTSLIAILKKQTSISIGNILGSNIFNILSVLGLVSIFSPLEVNRSIFSFEIPFMIFSGLILIPISLRNLPTSRWISLSMISMYTFFIIRSFR